MFGFGKKKANQAAAPQGQQQLSPEAMAILQQMQAQLALAQQWVAQQQAVGAKSNTREASKKQREIYVGNLAMNVVTPEILSEVFNSALLSLSKDGRTPVVHCNMAHDGKFAFVELRTEEISDAEELIAAFKENESNGRMAFSYKGQMVDVPHLVRAKEILAKVKQI